MTFTLYKWRNKKNESEFNSPVFYLRNGVAVEFWGFGFEFSFNKLHITLSLFSPNAMYEAQFIFNKKYNTFKDNILFEKTW
jgi:hypothetical protein